ncbi:MAG: TonB-dependent receptor, partial [Pseudomonadota bacterium]
LRLSRTEVALAATSVSNGATIRNTELTGSFGLRHDLTERVAITANLGRGFRAPNIFDLGTLGARPGNRFNIANPDLGPETVWTVDTGIEWQGETAELNAVVWYSDYIDQITSVSTGQVDAAGRDIVQSQNASESILYGIELAAAWEITRRLTLNATVNSVYGRTTLADGQAEPADRIPPLNGQLGLRYHHGDWWLRAQWRGADDQSRLSARDVRDPRIDPLGTPGFGVINLAGGWQISPVWRATLELHNAADRAFREHGSGIDAAGRAITVSLRGAW